MTDNDYEEEISLNPLYPMLTLELLQTFALSMQNVLISKIKSISQQEPVFFPFSLLTVIGIKDKNIFQAVADAQAAAKGGQSTSVRINDKLTYYFRAKKGYSTSPASDTLYTLSFSATRIFVEVRWCGGKYEFNNTYKAFHKDAAALFGIFGVGAVVKSVCQYVRDFSMYMDLDAAPQMRGPLAQKIPSEPVPDEPRYPSEHECNVLEWLDLMPERWG